MCVPVSLPIWQGCGRQPGPILAKRVEFGLTLEYLLNIFFGRWLHAKMENRSKHITPRAAAWLRPRHSKEMIL